MIRNPFKIGVECRWRKVSGERNVLISSQTLAVRLQRECAQLTSRFRSPAAFGYDPEVHRWWVRLEAMDLPDGLCNAQAPVIFLLSEKYPGEGPTDVLLPRLLTGENGWKVSDIIGVCGEEVRDEWIRCETPGVAWKETDNLCRLLEVLVAMLRIAIRTSIALSVERLVGGDGVRLTDKGDER